MYKNNTIKKRALLMCATPLQALIAERIIDLNPNTTFDLVFTRYSTDNKDKFDYYFERLSKKCIKNLNWTITSGLKGFLYFRAEFNKFSSNIIYEELYLSNIERIHFQYIVSQYSNSDIYTYDDGMGNINSKSKYYSNLKPSWIKRPVWYALGVKKYISDIRAQSKLHYTIYENSSNIIENTYLISLFNNNISTCNIEQESKTYLNMYLGQPLLEITDELDLTYISKMLEKLQIQQYYPHPREKKIPIGNFKVVNSKLIVEDYIVELLNNNPGLHVNLYSFISSAIINVCNIDRAHCFYIYNHYLHNQYTDYYKLVEDNFEVKTINLL